MKGVFLCFIDSTIYEGSDESKSKTGSTDSHGSSSHRSSSTASSVHSTTTQSIPHNSTVAVSTMMPPCLAPGLDDVASVVGISAWLWLI